MAVNLHATHYRFGNDDGSTEANHTFKANEDTNISLNKDTTFLLRIMVQETGGTLASNVDNQFQCSRNGGAFQNITTSSSICKAVAAASYVDAANTTKRLTGTGTFETTSAGCSEDGLSGGNANDLAASGCSETVCGLQIVGADTANGDSITFRLTSPDFSITNDVVPTLTVLHNVSVATGVGQPALTGLFPTAAATANATVDSGLGAVDLVGFQPTIDIQSPGITIDTGTGAGALTGFQPSLFSIITSGVGSLASTGFPPTVAVVTLVVTGVGSAVATGLAPTVVIQENFTALTGQGAAVVTGFSPSIMSFVTYGQPFTYTSSKWGSPSFFLEAFLRATSGTVHAVLIDDLGVQLDSSMVSVTSQSMQAARSSPIDLVDGRSYRVQFGKSGSDSGEFVGAKIIAEIS